MPNTRARMFAVLALYSGAVLAVSACDAYDEGLIDSDRTSQKSQTKASRRDADADADTRDAGTSDARDVDASEAPGRSMDSPATESSAKAAGAIGAAAGGGGSAAAAAATGGSAASGGSAAANGDSAGVSGGSAAGGGSAATNGGAAASGGSAGASGGAAGSGASPNPTAPAAPCTDASGRIWETNGHCYFPLSVMNSWYVNRDRCSELGAHLASITSAEEQAVVAEFVGASPRWIGLSRFGAPKFSWVDGEAMTYEHWEEGAPKQLSEAAVALRNETQFWFDDAVNREYGAICEREPMTDPATKDAPKSP